MLSVYASRDHVWQKKVIASFFIILRSGAVPAKAIETLYKDFRIEYSVVS